MNKYMTALVFSALIGPLAYASEHYTINAHGAGTSDDTVTDNFTLFEWQRGFSDAKTWSKAKTYCETGIKNILPGDGWRLPGVKELTTLVDVSKKTDPAIDIVAFPDPPGQLFWSFSPLAGGPGGAWDVFFNSGLVGSSNVDNTFRVRCVR